MGRLKKKSAALEKAIKRKAAMESISPNLDLGNGLTLSAYTAEVSALEQKIDTYNTLLSKADEAKNELHAQEKVVKDLSERMLDGVGSKFGHDSNQYEMAGGTRKSERKKPVRKPKATVN